MRSSTFAAVVLASLAGLAGIARAEPAAPAGKAAPTGKQVSHGGMVLSGARLCPAPDGAVAAWIEDPKTLVVAHLDGSGRVTSREDTPLAEPDAPVEDLLPVVRADGRVSVFLLERGVERLGQDVPLRRVIVRNLDTGTPAQGEAQPPARPLPALQVIVESPDDGSGAAPAALVSAGLYTAQRAPAVVWRRGTDTAEQRNGEAELTIVRDEVTSSAILGDARIATAVAWRDDGGALVAASDAGRPVVVDAAGESQIDVPTPAALTSLIAVGEDKGDWLAAGVDGARRLFVVAAEVNRLSQSYFLPVTPLVDAPADLSDAGTLVGAPKLVPREGGVALLWSARLAGAEHVRVRELDGTGRPRGASHAVLACPAGARILSMDALERADGGMLVAVTCAAGGRADVRAAAVP